MQQKSLADVLNETDVRTTFEGLYENHLKSIEMMRDPRNLHGRRDRVRHQ